MDCKAEMLGLASRPVYRTSCGACAPSPYDVASLWDVGSTPPCGIEKLRGQVDRTGGDSQGGLRPPEDIE